MILKLKQNQNKGVLLMIIQFATEEYSDDNILFHEFYIIEENYVGKKDLVGQINAFENGSINFLIFRDKAKESDVKYIKEFMDLVKANTISVIQDIKDYYIADYTDFLEDDEIRTTWIRSNSIQYVMQCTF